MKIINISVPSRILVCVLTFRHGDYRAVYFEPIAINTGDRLMTEHYNRKNSQRIFRLPQILNMYGISKSTVYRGIKQGTFPKPVKLVGKRAVGWLERDLRIWETDLGNVQQNIASQDD